MEKKIFMMKRNINGLEANVPITAVNDDYVLVIKAANNERVEIWFDEHGIIHADCTEEVAVGTPTDDWKSQ